MDELGLNALQTAKAAKLGDSFVRDILRGKTKSPSSENLDKLANALQVSTDYLKGKDDTVQETLELPIVGLSVVSEINAGNWREVTILDEEEENSIIPVARDLRFPRAKQYALLVRGDSMDLEYPDGSYVTCVEYWESGISMKNGLHVHVERRRAGGQLVEITVKVIDTIDGIMVLSPRSSNEKWKPIPLEGGEDVEVVIRGVVTGSWRPTII